MRIPGIKTTKAISRWVQARLLGGAMILGYHRVANVAHDEYEVCVSPEHFAEHMAVISEHAHPISLNELVKHLKTGSLPARSVAVTFDDGYVDNLYGAKPILEKYQIPATVFVSTGYLGREFWWDQLTRLVMTSHADPLALQVQSEKNQFRWNQPPTNHRSPQSEQKPIRVNFRHALYHFLLLLQHEEREQAMKTIWDWSELSENKLCDLRAMDQIELLKLIEGGLVEVGAHTRTHPMLTHLPLEMQREEITASKQDLEKLIDRQVTGFAYPNGKITSDATRMVKEAGFEYACISLHNVVRPGCDTHQLTRFWQKDVNGDKFQQGFDFWMTRQ